MCTIYLYMLLYNCFGISVSNETKFRQQILYLFVINTYYIDFYCLVLVSSLYIVSSLYESHNFVYYSKSK